MRFAADKDTGETVVSRLKRQLNKHYIRCGNILKTKAENGEAAETRLNANSLVMKTSRQSAKSQSGSSPDHYIRSLV